MLCCVDFVSKDVFEALAPCADLAVVSVGDPAETAPSRLAEHARALRLEFLDLDPENAGEEVFPDEVMFTGPQALELFEFVRRLDEDAKGWRLVVHCRMGISRSAAVAATAAAMTHCWFPRCRDSHYANRHVVRTVERTLGFQVPVPAYPEPGMLHDYLPSTLQI